MYVGVMCVGMYVHSPSVKPPFRSRANLFNLAYFFFFIKKKPASHLLAVPLAPPLRNASFLLD